MVAESPNSPAEKIEGLVASLSRSWPSCIVSANAPRRASGEWFVDVAVEGRSFVIQYRPELGFGLSSLPAEGYGEGPDEYLGVDTERVVERIRKLVETSSSTSPNRERLLRAVRILEDEASQRAKPIDLAELQRCVRAVGGELQVRIGAEVIPLAVSQDRVAG